MPPKEPLRYRILNPRNTPEIPGMTGDRTYDRSFVLCLSSGHHAVITLDNFIEFRSLKTLPLDLTERIKFMPCDCCRQSEPAPLWLVDALEKALAEPPPAKPTRAKPKKRPTMGAKRR